MIHDYSFTDKVGMHGNTGHLHMNTSKGYVLHSFVEVASCLFKFKSEKMAKQTFLLTFGGLRPLDLIPWGSETLRKNTRVRLPYGTRSVGVLNPPPRPPN